MKKSLLLLTLSLLIAGCSHVFTLMPDSPQSAYNDANQEGQNYPAHVIMHSGERYVVYGIRISPDSTSWQVTDSDSLHGQSIAAAGLQHPQVFPTWNVREIRIRNGTRGARDGAFLGALGGVVVGTAIASLDVHYLSKHGSFADPTAAQFVLETLAGAAVGTVVGTILGSTSVIRFEQGHYRRTDH